MQDAVNLAKQAGFSEQEIAQVQKIKQAQDTVASEVSKTTGIDKSLINVTTEGDSMKVSFGIDKKLGTSTKAEFNTKDTLWGKVGEWIGGVSFSVSANGSIDSNWKDAQGHDVAVKDETSKKEMEQLANSLKNNKVFTESASMAINNSETLNKSITSQRAEQIAKILL